MENRIVKQVAIFPIYYPGKENLPVYASDCCHPVMAGNANADIECEAFLKDDTGDNISLKNKIWGELTAQYWVLKNYLPKNPDVKYVGFCHYRRFFDLKSRPSKYLRHAGFNAFARNFQTRYSESDVLDVIQGTCDAIVPVPARMNASVKNNREQYRIGGHSVQDLECLEQIVRDVYPDYVPDMEEYLNDRKSYMWLQFVMRRDWANEFLSWQFDVLERLEAMSSWQEDAPYAIVRTPAFLAERFFNVWLRHKIRISGGQVVERRCIFLVPDEELGLLPQIRRYCAFVRDMLG